MKRRIEIYVMVAMLTLMVMAQGMVWVKMDANKVYSNIRRTSRQGK